MVARSRRADGCEELWGRDARLPPGILGTAAMSDSGGLSPDPARPIPGELPVFGSERRLLAAADRLALNVQRAAAEFSCLASCWSWCPLSVELLCGLCARGVWLLDRLLARRCRGGSHE